MRLVLPLAAFALLAVQAQAQTNEPAPPAHRSHMTFDQKFEAANTSHDGHLTLDQAKAGKLKYVARHFDAIDKDHRGYVTLDDAHAYYKTMRAARHHAKADEAATKS